MSTDVIKEAFEIVTSMENDLEDARVLADGLPFWRWTRSTAMRNWGAVFLQIAWQIVAHCEES